MENKQYNNEEIDYEINGDDDLDYPKKKVSVNSGIAKLMFFNSFVSILIGAFGFFLLFKLCPQMFGDTVTNITKTEKEVTVTDTGIADSVDKVMDTVVVVKTYKNDELYATGTGFIYKHQNGTYYMITNYHVIDGGGQIKVQFTDGTEAVVKVENGDKYADIAVLSIETNVEYSVIEVGNSLDTRVGDTVFVVGSPLDYEVYSWSVTRGILSGKDREVAVSVANTNTNDWIMQVLQTDAAINEGNSGGPLCNSNGQVIGVTNMKLASERIEGMGFAIPIEEAANYADAVINGEDLTRPYIGVSMSNASSSTVASNNGIEAQDGVLIETVESNSPAEAAGLKHGDIIVGMDNVKIKDVASLRYQLYKYKVGDTINIEYKRNGNSRTTKLTLGSNK